MRLKKRFVAVAALAGAVAAISTARDRREPAPEGNQE